MRVRFTPRAERQYLDALQYLRTKDPTGAVTVHRRTEAVLDLLREHPDEGHFVREFPDLPHREVSVAPYRFFYRRVEDTAWIVAVWHARQVPEPPADGARGDTRRRA